MKGVICSYSGTGNTALACQYIAHRMSIPFELVDAINACDVEMDQADAVGFVTSTDFWGVPRFLETFVEKQRALEGIVDLYSQGFEVQGLRYIDGLRDQTRVFTISVVAVSGKARRQ